MLCSAGRPFASPHQPRLRHIIGGYVAIKLLLRNSALATSAHALKVVVRFGQSGLLLIYFRARVCQVRRVRFL